MYREQYGICILMFRVNVSSPTEKNEALSYASRRELSLQEV